MALINDFGLETPERKLTLLLLSIPDSQKNTKIDILHLNKIIKYYEEETAKNEVIFSNFNLGAVSYEIEENIKFLEDYDLIEKDEKGFYTLTNIGEEAVRELLASNLDVDLKKLIESKEKLNDLSFDELLFYMYMKFPETIVNSTQFKKLELMSKNLIKKLFIKNKIDVGTANNWLFSSYNNISLKIKEKPIKGIGVDYDINELDSIIKESNYKELILFIENVFKQLELSPYRYNIDDNKDYQSDFIIWVNDLNHRIENPILVDIKLNAFKIGANKILNNFANILNNSNTKTGIILNFSKENNDLVLSVQKNPYVLFLDGKKFLYALKQKALANLIRELT